MEKRKSELDKVHSKLENEKASQKNVVSNIMSAATKIMLLGKKIVKEDQNTTKLEGVSCTPQPYDQSPTSVLAYNKNQRRVLTSRQMFTALKRHRDRLSEGEVRQGPEERQGLITVAMATERFSQDMENKSKVLLLTPQARRKYRARRRSAFLRSVLSSPLQETNRKSPSSTGASVSARWLMHEGSRSMQKNKTSGKHIKS